eukprot:TRINITY_DN2751_c0_g2_i1.p1 TRINITY_DN2751_c0_g2~~TRINITY_DN2751_c0_g2_i1.p1  ORF type:complete len:386 (+),score=91.03 TRINITY_DN2751_c0_g2_i1:27-1160(+)
MKYIYCFLFMLFIYSIDCGWEKSGSVPLDCNTNLRGNKIIAHQKYVVASFDSTYTHNNVGEQMILLSNTTLEVLDTLNFTESQCNFMIDLDNYNSTHFFSNCLNDCITHINFYTIENDKFVISESYKFGLFNSKICGMRLLNIDQSNPNVLWYAGYEPTEETSNDILLQFDLSANTLTRMGSTNDPAYEYYFGGVTNGAIGYGMQTTLYEPLYDDDTSDPAGFKIVQMKELNDNVWNITNKILPTSFRYPPLIFESGNYKNNECFLVSEDGNQVALTNFNFVDLTASGRLVLTDTSYPQDGPMLSKHTKDTIFIVGRKSGYYEKSIISRISTQSNGQFDQLLDQCLIDDYIYDFAVSDEGLDIFVVEYCGVERYTLN